MQEIQETQVQSLSQEDPLEEKMATHSSTLAWRIPWTEEPGRLQTTGLQRVGRDRSDFACTHMGFLFCITDLFVSSFTVSTCLDYYSFMLLLLLSHFSRVRLCATPQRAVHQAPPSLGFSRQEHWSGLPFPSPMHESEK